MTSRMRTRLAPSPTGALHLGNARTFAINWALARQRGWEIVLRIEDLDGPRIKPNADRQAIDVLRCMHRVRQQCKINDERIFGWGGSGGGNVILQCGKMAPNTFALIVEHAGITHPTNAADMEAGWDRPNRAGGWQGTALGGTKEYPEHEKLVRDPVHHADLFNTKVYVFHPDLDTTVGVQHGIQMAYALKAAGKDAVLELIEGGNHSSGGALDPNERSRKTSTEFYAGEDILTRRKSGPTDFDRREPVRLPVNDGMYYQVVYDVEDGLPRLEGPLED